MPFWISQQEESDGTMLDGVATGIGKRLCPGCGGGKIATKDDFPYGIQVVKIVMGAVVPPYKLPGGLTGALIELDQHRKILVGREIAV
jgi:hypothetical protein